MSTDRIEKKVLLKAPQPRVWSAISDSSQFGSWFGVAFDGPFVAGQSLSGRIVGTTVDPEVAKLQEPFEGQPFGIVVDRIEPMTLFSFRWHPYAVDLNTDYSREPTTLVTFELQEGTDGTLLTITESGFDGIPIERRAEAFRANDGGWTHQSQLIAKYVAMQRD